MDSQKTSSGELRSLTLWPDCALASGPGLPPSRRPWDDAYLSFEEALIDAWRQVLVEQANIIELGTERYPVRQTPGSRLRQVDFVFDGIKIRELEQNPQTRSRWAEMARAGKKVMQFLSEGRCGERGCWESDYIQWAGPARSIPTPCQNANT
jgi:hypothetical protein